MRKSLGDRLLQIIHANPICARCGKPITESYLGGNLCEDCTVQDYVRWKCSVKNVARAYLAVTDKTT